MLGLALVEGARCLDLKLGVHLAILAALEVVYALCISCEPQAA